MQTKPSLDELFERRLTFPDFEPQERLARLVGLDDHKERLSKILGLLVNPAALEAWAQKHHPDAKGLLKHVLRRPPLVVLAGDVGSGKTELAETIGDAVARQEKIEITLYPLSLSSRGQGRVGEMTQLLSAAFDYTVEAATKLKGLTGRSRGAVILLVDEADALAQSRELAQMHHEDRAGVNAFIRGIDRLANDQLPAAVIMCTNRLSALDPAVKRRAAEILAFERPNDAQRHAVLDGALHALGLSAKHIEEMVAATGKGKGQYGFTFSDLTQRLLPAIVLDAYPSHSVAAARAIEIARQMQPTPPFEEKKIMSGWSLPVLLASLHDDIQHRLQTTRKSFGHPDAKGDASEAVWLELLKTYLPERYRADKAYVVDSKGAFSDQIDVVVYDRQYSPFIFHYQGETIVPAESVYAIFEAKQTINANYVAYARKKVASVRTLHRTSLPIPHAGGTFSPKPLIPILGGILTFESDWSPCCGDPLWKALGDGSVEESKLNIGCVAAHGHFVWEKDASKYEFTKEGKPATAFLFKLISMLQFCGTVPMIDVNAYAEWLTK